MSLLLDHDNTLWDSHSKNGRTPLHTAAMHGRTAAVELMLERCQYDVDCADSCGSTALMDALRGGYTETAKVIFHSSSLILSYRFNPLKTWLKHS